MCRIGSGVDVRSASILNQGLGLWSEKSFAPGDIITFYDGEPVNNEDLFSETLGRQPGSHTLTIFGSIFAIQGLRLPYSGAGGGSFANHRPQRVSNASYVCLDRAGAKKLRIDYAISPDVDMDAKGLGGCAIIATRRILPQTLRKVNQ